jgi:uncharacterized membrane protein
MGLIEEVGQTLRDIFLSKTAPVAWSLLVLLVALVVYSLHRRARERRRLGAGAPANFVSPKTVALYGILTALTAAVTYASYLPFSPTKGYFNLGETMVFFSALAIGWREGAICGGIGSAAADILLGSGIYAPITALAKGAEGFIAGVLGRLKGGAHWGPLLGIVIGILIAVAASWPLPGKVWGVDEWIILSLLFLAVWSVVFIVFQKWKELLSIATPMILGIAAGGAVMVVSYFMGEYFLLSVGLGKALAEVPINVAQVVIGGTIGGLLSFYVKRSYPRLASR